MRNNRHRLIPGLLGLLLLVFIPSAATGQISRVGSTALLTASVGELHGNDVAYDPVNDVYLVVAAYRSVWGAFVSGSGTPLGGVFLIKAGSGWPTAHYARVKYSPHLTNGTSGSGGFLVTWHQDVVTPGSNIVFARAVAYGVGPTGPELPLSSGPTYWNNGPAIVYSETSRRFLVVWTTLGWGIEGRFIDVAAGSGLPSVSSGILSIAPPAGGGAMSPGAAWDPVNDQFGVSYTGFGAGGAFSGFVRVRTGDGLVSGRATFGHSAGNFISDIDFNSATGNFVMAWSSSFGSTRAEFTPASGLVGSGLISSTLGTVNTMGLSFNPVSGTFLATGHGATCSVAGVELDSDGAPLGTATPLNDCGPGDTGSFFPRPTGRRNDRHFGVSFSQSLTKLSFQRIATASTGKNGGGGGTPPGPAPAPPPPPPPSTNPQMNVDLPANNTSLPGSVTVAGWAIDLGAPEGSGVSTVHVWAWPTTGASPTFLGAASAVSRPDVGAAFGNARFGQGGFAVTATLPPGTYDIAAYAMSSVTGTFNNSQVRRVTVTAPQSIPRMAVDLPVMHQSFHQHIRIAGWAIDVGSPSGTGVGAVHVWAYPVAGGNPIFVGTATLGQSRPDVGAAFGHSRFNTAGYNLEVNGALPPGSYNLVVFAFSTVAGAFNNAAVVTIYVQ
jgi:hypothetical protein